MKEKRNACKIFMVKPEATEKSRGRWEDDIVI
jgi:hypothetical protein